MPSHRFKKGEVSNPNGRPPRVLKPIELRRVEALAARGFHEITMATVLGMSGPSWLARKRDTPALVEAIARGRARYHDYHVNILNKYAAKGAWVASLATLKSKFGWREGDTPGEMRPQVIINLPAPSNVEQYTRGLTIDAVAKIGAADGDG